jgi:hypothetical protein
MIGNVNSTENQHETGNGFNRFFKYEKAITISEAKRLLGSIRTLCVDLDNNFRILDSRQNLIHKYSRTGKFISVIGGKGQGPGEFVKAFDFFIGKKNIYVVDPKARKAHVFNLDGVFKYFFFIEDGRAVKEGKNGEVVISAPIIKTLNKSACIHIYSKDGKIKKSFFPINKNAVKHEFICDGVFFDIDREGNLYCIQEMEYNINRYTISGRLVKTFSGKNPLYIPPPEKVFKKKYLRSSLSKWMETWSHIVGINILDNMLIVTHEYNKTPFEYMLDIYSRDGDLIIAGLATNYRLLYIDKTGKFYFSHEAVQADLNESTYHILIYSIKNKKLLISGKHE